MPKSVQNPLSQRKEVRDQDTFRYTTPDLKTPANPVDPFVHQAKPQKEVGLHELMDSLGVLAEINSDYQRAVAERERELGVVDVMRGLGEPGSSHPERIKAYETISGEVAAGEYHAKVAAWSEENKHLLPGEFDAGLQQLRNEAINGRSNYFMAGLAKRAMSVEEQARVQNRTFLADSTQQGVLMGIGKLIDTDINPDTISKVTNLPGSMRGYLTGLQEKGKSLVERKQITELFTQKMVAMADQLGRPELLAFADQPDKDGYKVINDPRLASMVTNGIQAATASKERMEANTLRDAKDAERKQKMQVSNGFVSEMFQIKPGDPEFRTKISSIIGRLDGQKDTMDDGDFRVLRQMAYEIEQSGGFRKSPDFDKYHEAMDLAKRGQLENITPYLPFLDVASYNQLVSTQDRAADGMSDRRYSRSVNNQQAFLDEGKSLAAGTPDPMLKTPPPGYEKRVEMFNQYYRTRLEEEMDLAQEAGGYIPVATLKQIQKEALDEVYKWHGKPESWQGATQMPTTGSGGSAAVKGSTTMSVRDRLKAQAEAAKKTTEPEDDLKVIGP